MYLAAASFPVPSNPVIWINGFLSKLLVKLLIDSFKSAFAENFFL